MMLRMGGGALGDSVFKVSGCWSPWLFRVLVTFCIVSLELWTAFPWMFVGVCGESCNIDAKWLQRYLPWMLLGVCGESHGGHSA